MTDLHLHKHEGHSHSLRGQHKSQQRIGIAALITFAFMFAEIVGGVVSGSLALLADAAHMLTDAGSLLLAFLGYQLARRPADVRRTFGFSRFKVLAAFANGLLLVLLAGWIVWEAVERMITPQPVLSGIMFWIAVAGLVVNIAMFFMLHTAHEHDHDHEDLNMSGAIAHVIGDLLGSVAAVAAAIIIHYTDLTIADPLLSILVAGLLFRSAYFVITKSSHILLQGTPKGIDLEAISHGIVSALPAVRAVHHMHAWTLTGNDRLITLHVVPVERQNAIDLIPDVRKVLAEQFGIDHATIELDLEPLEECDFPSEHAESHLHDHHHH